MMMVEMVMMVVITTQAQQQHKQAPYFRDWQFGAGRLRSNGEIAYM